MADAVPETSPLARPDWPHCGRGAIAQETVGCRGRQVAGHSVCLAHLDDAERAAYLATVSPGDDLDHRGTPFTRDLLDQLLAALHYPAQQGPYVGGAVFREASFVGDVDFHCAAFDGDVDFNDVTFTGRADLHGTTFNAGADFCDASFAHVADFGGATFNGETHLGVTFTGDARFDGATFSGGVEFSSAVFAGHAWFGGAAFTGEASFGEASFARDARFGGVRFGGDAEFVDVVFDGDVHFGGATFVGDAGFERSRLHTVRRLGPLACGGTVRLDNAVFGAPVTVEIAAAEASFRRTRWESAAALRIRRAAVHLAGAVLEQPVTVVTYPVPFTDPLGDTLSEAALTGRDATVRLKSLDGVDAAHLTLTDVDLTGCALTGVVHLDHLRLEDTTTSRPPTP
ncbi:pentapeptide repeat-containing protein [Streptomyces sp. NPDC002790]|uniref:pentapeptide repeat-containing protein n=1 Tax=Streptomyces sp. NPDC002790 TaxID=3154431 RepID=UPI0033311484